MDSRQWWRNRWEHAPSLHAPFSLLGVAFRYERWLRETDQWYAMELFARVIYPAIGRLAGRGKPQFSDLTPEVINRSIRLAIQDHIDPASARWAWIDFFDWNDHDLDRVLDGGGFLAPPRPRCGGAGGARRGLGGGAVRGRVSPGVGDVLAHHGICSGADSAAGSRGLHPGRDRAVAVAAAGAGAGGQGGTGWAVGRGVVTPTSCGVSRPGVGGSASRQCVQRGVE